ncbi:hypothetical protein HOI18_02360, partial [Candidatus Uhrbacteria bacterium]|nr:hypothetical protein [Candidatus Uhrbacteria bacterium]
MSRVTVAQLVKFHELIGSKHGPSFGDLQAFIDRPQGPIMPSGPGGHIVLSSERLPDEFGTQNNGVPIEAFHSSVIKQLTVDPEGNPALLTVVCGEVTVCHRGMCHDVSSATEPMFYEDASGFNIVGFRHVANAFFPITLAPLEKREEGCIAVYVRGMRQDQIDGLVGYHPLRDGSVIRVVRLPLDGPLADQWYSLEHDSESLSRGAIRVNPEKIALDKDGVAWVKRGGWVAPYDDSHAGEIKPGDDPYVVDLIGRAHGLELVVGGADSSGLVGAKLMQPNGDTWTDLSFVSRTPTALPYHRGMQVVDSNDGIAYVTKRLDGQEAW